ncbi:MAG: hypothetical protein H0X30_05625 [Anaerolineae bacterium]|nr:hypothetical protein [Anaerolineae bacterium]
MTTTHNLKPLEKIILETIEGAGGAWLTRKDITQRIGRPKGIQPNDLDALARLTEIGLIESKQDKRGLVGVKWVYRATV